MLNTRQVPVTFRTHIKKHKKDKIKVGTQIQESNMTAATQRSPHNTRQLPENLFNTNTQENTQTRKPISNKNNSNAGEKRE